MATTRTLVARTGRIRTRFSRAKTDRGTKPSDPPGRDRKSGLARSRICARHADPHPRCCPRPTTSFRVRISDIDGIQGSPPCHRQTRARLPAIDEPRTHLLAVNQLPGSRPSRRSTSSFAPYPSVQLGSAFAHRRVYGFARHPSAHPWFGFRPSTQCGFASWTFKGRKRLQMDKARTRFAWRARIRTLVDRTDKTRTLDAPMDTSRTPG